jgi:leucine dehydrogenase
MMTPFEASDFDAHEAVHFFTDPHSGLRAIIAIHSTALGPAAGGARYWTYASSADALTDVLRLSKGMTYKNAMADLPLGGGKAVILRQPQPPPSQQLFEAFGRAIESLGGRYITAEDVGTTVGEMQYVARATRYVSGLKAGVDHAGGDPSPKTALGVYLGLEYCWRHLMRRDLAGARVAVQGLGGVGYALARRLHEAGAKLVVSDVNLRRLKLAQVELAASAVTPEEILSAEVDIIAPCALGGILNVSSIPRIRARLIAGGANNQLATGEDGERLRSRGIWYAPDYVINAGGIINVASEYLGQGSETEVLERIARIPIRLGKIFTAAAEQGLPTNVVADQMARERLARSTKTLAPV